MPFWKAWLNAMVWNRGDWRLFFSSWVSLKIEPSTSQLELLELAYCQTWCWPLVVELFVNFCPYGLGRSCHSQHSLVSSIRLLVFSSLEVESDRFSIETRIWLTESKQIHHEHFLVAVKVLIYWNLCLLFLKTKKFSFRKLELERLQKAGWCWLVSSNGPCSEAKFFSFV